MKLYNNEKGQGLPLNTIVIALLVITVLLVIIVFFTSSVGESGDTINQVKGCSIDNPALSTVGYTNVETISKPEDDLSCPAGTERISLIPSQNDPENEGYKLICCGSK